MTTPCMAIVTIWGWATRVTYMGWIGLIILHTAQDSHMELAIYDSSVFYLFIQNLRTQHEFKQKLVS